jgi:membrane-associated protease RseP (regulator of RpoE activity)
MAIAGWLIGAPIERVSLFFGPLIHSIKVRDVSFDIRAYPVGGFVKFTEDAFKNIHPIRRAFVAAAGCTSLLLLSLAVLGFSQGLHRFGTGFYQLFAGALYPRLLGAKLLLNLYHGTAQRHIISTIAVVAGKMAAVNLLPLPNVNGGEILILLISTITPISESLKGRLYVIGLLIFLAVFLLWLLALLFFGKSLINGG